MSLGTYFLKRLKEIQSPLIAELRGRGLFIGIDLNGSRASLLREVKEKGLLCKETHEHIIRLAPPLTITREELDWAWQHVLMCCFPPRQGLDEVLCYVSLE